MKVVPIKVSLSSSSVSNAIEELEDYQNSFEEKRRRLCQRLAEMGAVNVSLGFARSIYTGDNDFTVSVEPYDTGYRILASGTTVLFVEFGAGVTYGYGHPLDGELGMGPGTYPLGKGNWDNPKGWTLPKSKGGQHTYGNPPNMPMYNTAQDLKREIERVATEVFGE